MIKSWLKRKFYDIAYESGLKDIERFILTLRAQSDEQMAMTLAIATQIRLYWIQRDIVREDVMEMMTSSQEHASAQMLMNRFLRMYQGRKDYDMALGIMVWLHSVRSQAYPELRIKGQEMWRELSRGMDGVDEAAQGLNIILDYDMPDNLGMYATYIPSGLDR